MHSRYCLFIILFTIFSFGAQSQQVNSRIPALSEVKMKWLDHWKIVKPYFNVNCNDLEWTFKYIDSLNQDYNNLVRSAENIRDSLKAKEVYVKMFWETDEVILKFQFLIIGTTSMTVLGADPFDHRIERQDFDVKIFESITTILSKPCKSCNCHKIFGTIISKIENGTVVDTRISW